jgi:hypothetical protein
VRISVAARKLSSSGETTTEGTDPASAMRELLAKYDFHSITPRQMAEVGGALYERHEISTDAASSFIGVETNLVEPMDADKPIDMVQHFQHMLDVAADANKREPGYFDFAVKFRQEASRALTDVMTFVADDRSHVSTAR